MILRLETAAGGRESVIELPFEQMETSIRLSPPLDFDVHDTGADWIQAPLDFEWLRSAPFEMDFEGSIAESFM